MKKIAIIVFDITKRAGTERAVCNLANLLTESKKYSISIISIYSTLGEASYNINNNIKIYHLGLPLYKNKIARLRLYGLLFKKAKTIFNENNIDIVIGTTHGINCGLFLFGKIVKKVACEHLNYLAAPISSRIVRRIIYSFLDAVVVLTASDAKNYLFHKNVKLIPNSLSFIPDKQSKLLNKRILAVGRLTYQKGFDLLINTISIIKNECNGWELVIIGSGEEEDRLKIKIKDLNLEDIIKIFPPTDNIMQEYLKASVFVLSSRFEGLPMVMLEAQSCGLPIVGFDCPEGPAEIIHHNEDGLLVKNGNIEELSRAILCLIQNQEKRIQFGKKALLNVQKYKPGNIFKLWDDLITTL